MLIDLGLDLEQSWEDWRLARHARSQGDLRTLEQLREHYAVERELADRLRHAPRSQRRGLYTSVYDELFRRLPHHPQLTAPPPDSDNREIDRLLAFLDRFLTPSSVYMEIGPGDCALALRVAARVRHVYAVDVSETITASARRPANFTLKLSDGCSTEVPDGTVDVAFSNQLMEHLHPDDAAEQLANIHRSLAPGGRYVCFTPNRLLGPNDISSYFGNVARGFHLREYSAREIREEFRRAGFVDVRFYAVAGRRVAECPYGLLAALEGGLELLPRGLCRPMADTKYLRAVLGLRVVATKGAAIDAHPGQGQEHDRR
jgi:SAM-dependent methyltransferase